jgi:hypothetical protein
MTTRGKGATHLDGDLKALSDLTSVAWGCRIRVLVVHNSLRTSETEASGEKGPASPTCPLTLENLLLISMVTT